MAIKLNWCVLLAGAEHNERMERFHQAGLYVVITESFCAGRSAIDVLDACLDAGVQLVQFREKHSSALELYARAQVFREHTARSGALLIIDDRVDIALAVGADGVHLGTSDLPIAAARRIAPDLILGASSHNIKEAREAQQAGASYVNIGPIFPTQTKDVPTGVIGLDAINAITPHLTVPYTCMGGIKESNVGEVLARGAQTIAVVTAVTSAEDVCGTARRLRNHIIADRR